MPPQRTAGGMYIVQPSVAPIAGSHMWSDSAPNGKYTPSGFDDPNLSAPPLPCDGAGTPMDNRPPAVPPRTCIRTRNRHIDDELIAKNAEQTGFTSHAKAREDTFHEWC